MYKQYKDAKDIRPSKMGTKRRIKTSNYDTTIFTLPFHSLRAIKYESCKKLLGIYYKVVLLTMQLG